MLHEIFSLFFPRLCLGCGCPLNECEEFLCEHCKFDLPFTNYHSVRDNPVEQCFWGKVPVERAASMLYYHKKGIVQSVIHSLKYRQCPEVGNYLGAMAAHCCGDFFCGMDYLMPVPLHKKKIRQRGYNQSHRIAEGIASVAEIAISEDLKRVVYTATQTHKDKFERYENTLHSFCLDNPQIYEGKHILLVDDVLTTGSTLESCVRAVLQAQPNVRISVFTLGYAK